MDVNKVKLSTKIVSVSTAILVLIPVAAITFLVIGTVSAPL